MKDKLVKLTSDKPACAGFDDEYFYISTLVNHETFDQLRNAAKESRSGRNGYSVVQLKSIEEITCYQKAEDFFFRTWNGSKRKKYGLQISSSESRLAFCEELALASGLKSRTEKNDPYSRIQRNAIPIIMTALFTAGCSICASHLMPLASRESRGRAMSEALKAVGPTAILIIGLALIGFFVFRMIKNIRASDTKIEYSF